MPIFKYWIMKEVKEVVSFSVFFIKVYLTTKLC